ncbi:hypothetical protein KBA73_03960 [Patescibacteria group bacterium]|nr:hypothetical protein [Patescibacteria group bacterium]
MGQAPVVPLAPARLRNLLGAAPARFARHPEVLTVDLPLCGRRHSTYRDRGLISDVYNAFKLSHLERIHQLQFMTPERLDPRVLPYTHGFQHTRWEHSVAAAWIMEELGQRLKLDEPLIKLAVILDLLHDHALPPGGDATKNLYHQRGMMQKVDEDAQFLHRFDRFKTPWLALKDKYGLPDNSRELLGLGIKGVGILGEMHDVADTLSYLSLDTDAIARYRDEVDHAMYSKGLHQALELADESPGRNVIESARLVLDQGRPRLVIDDVDGLMRMLELRFRMWYELYTAREHKYLEFLYIELLGPELMRRGRLTVTRMRDRGDDWLHQEIATVFGHTELLLRHQTIAAHGPETLCFDRQEQVLEAERQAFETGAFTLLAHRRVQARTSNKTNKYFVQVGGEVLPFSQAVPERMRTLEEILQQFKSRQPWGLYRTYPPFELPQKLRETWLKARARWHTPSTTLPFTP